MSGQEIAASWIGVIGVAVGAIFALLGAGLNEWGSSRRARRAEMIAEASQVQDRRHHLWEISLPASSRVQESFSRMIRMTRPSSAFIPVEHEIPFEDGFPDWWDGQALALRSDIAQIPSATFRESLLTVYEALELSGGFVKQAWFAHNQESAVNHIADVGFDIVSAWIRAEQEIETLLQTRLADIAAELTKLHADIDESYRQEIEAHLDPKGYGRGTSVGPSPKPSESR